MRMKTRRPLRSTLFVWIWVMLLCDLSAHGASSFGQIRGGTRNVFGKPMPWTEIILRAENGNRIYEVMSASDGSFLVEHVTQGC